jgi:hypothetical protein
MWWGKLITRQLSSGPLGGTQSMITIKPHNLHWLAHIDAQDDPCLHGDITVHIGDELVFQLVNEEYPVSAAGLHLLRTITGDHTPENNACGYLFPHCGYWIIDPGQEKDVAIVGCVTGVNIWIRHAAPLVYLDIPSSGRFTVSEIEWRNAVLSFTRPIEKFYVSGESKKFSNREDRKGYEGFWNEWRRRIEDAQRAA